MRAEAIVKVPGGRVDVGRGAGTVAIKVQDLEGNGLTLCPTPEQARRLAIALQRAATLCQLYSPPTLEVVVAHARPEPEIA